MPNAFRWWIATVAIAVCTACTSVNNEPVAGRWIRFDARTQRFAIDAPQVSRAALLDELGQVAGVSLRPRPEVDDRITAKADGLDLDALLVLLMPPGSHYSVRTGMTDLASATARDGDAKRGPPVAPFANAGSKPDTAIVSSPSAAGGVQKEDADGVYVPREVVGPGAKAPAASLLRVSDPSRPKQALPTRIERSTVRIVLQFDDGAAPRVIDAQTLEGRAPAQRFVVGTYLYAVVAADGSVLEAGTFQDPLVQRSYQPEGPHAVQRAKSGTVGISVAREHLAGSRIQIVDLTGIALPRELNEDVVRGALAKGRRSLQIETAPLIRSIEQEKQP